MSNIHIIGSYSISKRDFANVIEYQSRWQKAQEVTDNRTMYSLVAEWSVHNVCYNLGLWRDRTADVDLDYPCKYEWLYKLTGWFCWLFIK